MRLSFVFVFYVIYSMVNPENIIDISWPISQDMTTYKNSKPVDFIYEKNFRIHPVRDTKITLNSHTGTHIDAPSHFLEEGETVEKIALENLVGPCRVLDFTHIQDKITDLDFESSEIREHEIILLKTKNSFLGVTAPFNQAFVYLDKMAAQLLALKKIKTVGIDYLGIEREQPSHETHCVLFKNKITIIEGLRLANVEAGNYFLCCLPLAIQGLEAAPARAILIRQ